MVGGENSEERKATNCHEREDSQAQKQPRLTDEWTAFFFKGREAVEEKTKKNTKNEETKGEPGMVKDGGGHQGMAPSALQKKQLEGRL